MAFQEINPNEITGSLFDKISKQWMLISAGTPEKSNTMTASWGGFGVLWFSKVATIYIRHSRYTLGFVEEQDRYTLTFLKDGHRDALKICGSKSGREMDKMHDAGLTPVFVDGQPTFEEAEYVVICKKLYADDIKKENFCYPETVEKSYPQGDYHRMFIGEIEKVYENR